MSVRLTVLGLLGPGKVIAGNVVLGLNRLVIGARLTNFSCWDMLLKRFLLILRTVEQMMASCVLFAPVGLVSDMVWLRHRLMTSLLNAI